MTEAMTTAFSTALTTIQTDVTGMITTALPIALGLFGIGMALDGVKTSSQAWLHNGLRRTEKVSLGIIYNKLFLFPAWWEDSPPCHFQRFIQLLGVVVL